MAKIVRAEVRDSRRGTRASDSRQQSVRDRVPEKSASGSRSSGGGVPMGAPGIEHSC